jgi:hypothetical protein
MGLLLCSAAFVLCFLLGRRSVVLGLGGVLTAGYFYGILRANYLDSFTYFLFDAAVIGFYLALLSRRRALAVKARVRELERWLWLLLGWAAVMFLIPIQHPLIQLVGLRGNALLLPFLLVGGWLERRDADRLALWLAILNLIAFAFALGEYWKGVPAFYPQNAVTSIIYISNDVAGYTAHRIPACFANAHSYGGTMVMTLPWLAGAWMQPGRRLAHNLLLVSGIVAALVGTFMCAARLHVVILVVLITLTLLSSKMRWYYWAGWILIIVGIAYVVSGEERMQRFTTLQDTDSVVERIQGSVNKSFTELIVSYPMGNGLGGGGTSIPYFLQSWVRDPVGLENEYSRILLELGVPGLCLWLGFIGWLVLKWPARSRDPWLLGRRLMWYAALASFATGLIGTGLLTSIPQTVLLLIGVGFLTTQQRGSRPAPAPAEDVARPVEAKV